MKSVLTLVLLFLVAVLFAGAQKGKPDCKPKKNCPSPTVTPTPTPSPSPTPTLPPPTPSPTPTGTPSGDLIAHAGYDIESYAGEAVRLDGTESVGNITNIKWETGDGYIVNSLLKSPHVYQTPGLYVATLTISNGAETSSDYLVISVKQIEGLGVISLNDSGDAEVNRVNLQNALDSTTDDPNGTDIIVPPGFTANDPIVVPFRGYNTYVTIRTSSELPDGVRVTPADRSKLWRINARGAGESGYNQAIILGPNSRYTRFLGLEILRTGGFKNDIIAVDNVDWMGPHRPSHIIFDRVLIDGNNTETVRAFAPNGDTFSLLNSTITDIKAIGYESKAIGMWTGEGNLAVINNHLEGASINVLVGGAYTHEDIIPEGIVFRNNYCWKNPNLVVSDGQGKGYAVKNLFELKSGINVVAEDNVFENNWADGQSGASILFTLRGDGQPKQTIQNVSFRKNLVLNVSAGVNILPEDDYEPTIEVKNLYIENNKFLNVGSRSLQLLPQAGGGGKNINFKHNTIRMRGGAGISIDGTTNNSMQIFIESNDWAYFGDYGMHTSWGEGYPAFDLFFTSDSTFLKNLIAFWGRGSVEYANTRYPWPNHFSFSPSDSYLDDKPFSHLVGTDGAVVGANW
jgi:PKD repeat protein